MGTFFLRKEAEIFYFYLNFWTQNDFVSMIFHSYACGPIGGGR